MSYLTVTPKLRISYIDHRPENGGETVILLHGLGATGESWGLQIPALLQAGFRVIAPDVRGFGRSTYPGGGSSITHIAQDIFLLMDHCQVKKATVVGISMGGTIALQFALDHPGRVNRLVLVNTFASLRPNNIRIWFYFLIRAILVHTLGLPIQAKSVANHIFPRPEQAEFRKKLIEQILQADIHGYRAAMRALVRFNVRSRLHEIKVPTLVITGESDTTVPPINQRDLVASIEGAQQLVIPQAGHAIIADHPDEFNQALLDFLAN
jgi:3-oxoadipate enol-lactonase